MNQVFTLADQLAEQYIETLVDQLLAQLTDAADVRHQLLEDA
jgi:hypothetical protein